MSATDLPTPATPSAQPRTALHVVHIGPPQSLDEGPATYRTLQPCRALGELSNVQVLSGCSRPTCWRPRTYW